MGVPPSAYRQAPGFDPYNQSLAITFPNGETTVDVPMEMVMLLQNTTVITAIIYGIQVGGSLLLLMILAVMTKSDKRRSTIFFLNLAALLLIFTRSIMMCAALQGSFYNFYNWSIHYYEHADNAIRLGVAGEVVNFLVIVTIELSLLFQVRIVCCTLKTRWRLVVAAVTSFVAVGVCGIRFATMVINARIGIVKIGTITADGRAIISTMASATNISVICSIMFFSAIFCAKLGHAIYQRRALGMKQFGPMQIIFVMGCQTMFIPVIFGLLTYFVVEFSQIYSLMPMVVATFLPLSSMWASTSTKKDNIAAPRHVKRNRDMVVSPSNKTGGSSGNYTSEKDLLDNSTLVGDGDTPTKPSHSDRTDNERGYGQKIHVNRTYTVRSD